MEPLPPNSSKINIILDTNILKRIADIYSFSEFAKYITDLERRNGIFAISDFTLFELFRGATVKVEHEIEPILTVFDKFIVTSEVLLAAARLETLYKMENIQPNDIEEGDKIIAGTALLNGCLILTSNGRDFPWPFFKEIERNLIEYKDKNKRTKYICVTLIQPDYDILTRMLNDRPR